MGTKCKVWAYEVMGKFCSVSSGDLESQRIRERRRQFTKFIMLFLTATFPSPAYRSLEIGIIDPAANSARSIFANGISLVSAYARECVTQLDQPLSRLW